MVQVHDSDVDDVEHAILSAAGFLVSLEKCECGLPLCAFVSRFTLWTPSPLAVCITWLSTVFAAGLLASLGGCEHGISAGCAVRLCILPPALPRHCIPKGGWSFCCRQRYVLVSYSATAPLTVNMFGWGLLASCFSSEHMRCRFFEKHMWRSCRCPKKDVLICLWATATS